MTTHTHRTSPLPRGTVPLAVTAAVLALAAALLFCPTSEGPLGTAHGLTHDVLALFGTIGPFVLAAIVAGLAPRDVSRGARITVGVVGGLVALFVARLWVGDVAEPPSTTPESSHLLSWLIGLPMASGAFVLFLPRQSPKFIRTFTLVAMLGTLGASLLLLSVPMDRTFHFNQDLPWIDQFGIRYHVALDGISLWLVILTTFIVPIATFASFGSITTRIKDWCFALLFLEGAMIGAFLSLDLFLFYVFWELMLVPMYVMIGVWGGANRVYAAMKFFLYTMAGSVLMLGAILYLGYSYSKVSGGQWSFDFFELQRLMLPQSIQVWIFGAFLLSFIIKVPMFPVHTWLPDAHTEAPTAGSVILAAVMLKLGTYGYLRFNLGLFPEASHWAAANLAGVAVLFGILYGALCAWKQDDIKRLVAYSSVAHLGYVMLGIFAGTKAGVDGAVLQMVNHGISTGALFLLVGILYDRRHTRAVNEFGGIAKVMPIYAAFFVLATLASIGVPGTNGFVGEFMVISGTMVSKYLGHFNGVQAFGAAIGVILGALYMLGVVEKVFFGPITKDENKKLSDMNSRELIAMTPLAIVIFVIGLCPNIFTSRIGDSTSRVLADLQSRIEMNPPVERKPYGGYYDGPIKLLARHGEAPALAATPQAEGGH